MVIQVQMVGQLKIWEIGDTNANSGKEPRSRHGGGTLVCFVTEAKNVELWGFAPASSSRDLRGCLALVSEHSHREIERSHGFGYAFLPRYLLDPRPPSRLPKSLPAAPVE